MWLPVALTILAQPVVVTVDDLPLTTALSAPDRARTTEALLAALAKHQIKAVGLVTWSRVGADGEKLLDRWLAAGHELGNHSDRHLSHTKLDSAAYLEDLERGRSKLAAYLASRKAPPLRFFRFPFLEEGDTPAELDAARAYLARSGQRNLPVTIDNQDWSFDEPFVKAANEAARSAVRERYHEAMHAAVRFSEKTSRGLFSRDDVPQILLLHANAIGASEWDALFAWLARTGHTFVTVDQALADPAFATAHAYVGEHGSSLWLRILAERRSSRAFSEVRALLETQAAAWNRGDHAAFCAVYADDARFVSPSGLTIGRAAVQARYEKKYPDKAAMGTLSLEVLHERAIAGTEITYFEDAIPSRVHGVSLVARWKLSYGPEKPEASGLTQLVLMRRKDGWMIVEDASM